jgi:N-methylhydantoinase B
VSTLPAEAIEREVIAGFLTEVTAEMHSALVRTAYSLNVKERGDCASAVLDSTGNSVALTAEAPLHLGSMLGLGREIDRSQRLREAKPGDVFVANDPYSGGGTHLPDVAMLAPVFATDRIVGYVCNLAHHSDIGGSRPGSMASDNTEIYQEGLRLPVVQLASESKIRDDILNIILLNSRLPDERRGDLFAQYGAIRVGVERTEALCRRYGVASVERSMTELMGYSERRVRGKIRDIGSGIYTSSEELDGSERTAQIHLDLTVKDDGLIFDFSRTARQLPAANNVPLDALKATVYTVVKQVLDPEVPANSGYYRALDVIATPGTVVNPTAPAAVADRAGTCNVIGDVIIGALSKAVPALAMAGSGPHARLVLSGTDRTLKRTFVDFETLAGAMGAAVDRDGLDAVRVFASGMANQPIEATEQAFPVEVLAYELVTDTGGPGRTRGGMSTRRKIRVKGEQLQVSASGERAVTAAPGLHGGQAGGLPHAFINEGTDLVRSLPLNSSGVALKQGDVVTLITAGGGGYGDPIERDADLVLKDWREGRVSIRQALDTYGVVIKKGEIDWAATTSARDRGATYGTVPVGSGKRCND